MPFVTKEKRELLNRDWKHAEEFGDICYLLYKPMVEMLKTERRWKTVHELYRNMLTDTLWLQKYRGLDKFTRNDWITALHLAWQVFFVWYVVPLEEEKEEVNGEI